MMILFSGWSSCVQVQGRQAGVGQKQAQTMPLHGLPSAAAQPAPTPPPPPPRSGQETAPAFLAASTCRAVPLLAAPARQCGAVCRPLRAPSHPLLWH